MLFYMNSKELVKYFLPFERDEDILSSWYILVSTRISKRSGKDDDENVIITKCLYPDASVCQAINSASFVDRYKKQLEDNLMLLATIVNSSCIEEKNIIFLCTKNESLLNYFPVLADYIWEKFKYPMYNYIEFTAGCKLRAFDMSETAKICDKLFRKFEINKASTFLKSDSKKELKSLSKKNLKDLLKSKDLYVKGMDKSEMIDTLIVYKDLFIK